MKPPHLRPAKLQLIFLLDTDILQIYFFFLSKITLLKQLHIYKTACSRTFKVIKRLDGYNGVLKIQ